MSFAQIFNRNQIFEELCRETLNLGFEAAGISLVSTEHHTIEAVFGLGELKGMEGRSKHYLANESELRDIQADIVATGKTEIIGGWDDRFDEWIYKEFNHERLVRVFTPLLICRDNEANLIDDWFEDAEWIEISPENTDSDPQHRSFKLILHNDRVSDQIVIGTLEACLMGMERSICPQQVNALNRLAASKAVPIWKTKLLSLLEEIAQEARTVLKADAATINYLFDTEKQTYIYQAYSCKTGLTLLQHCPPRIEGIGRQAIESATNVYVPPKDSSLCLKFFNDRAFQLGFKAIAAFPLKLNLDGLFSSREKQDNLFRHEGVLYVASSKQHPFYDIEEEALKFTRRASDTIQQVLIYKHYRERNRQLSTLHDITKALADISYDNSLLQRIAWDGLNILAADVVILYEYTQSINAFQTPPIIAGRLLRKEEMLNSISNENVVPAWLVQQNKSFYCPFVDQHPEISQSAFANREKVKSVAGVQLKVADEIVGVMFINYRRLHEFTHEKQIIETLASSAAVAIKNQRWLRARSDIERMVITTFSQQDLLDSILSKAVLLSNSETGSILLQDPHSKDIKLDVKASYDVTGSCHSQDVHRLEIREKTISKVSREKRPIFFDSLGKSGGSSISILSIPLLYSNDRLLGVLTLESTYPNTLVRRQIKMVQTLVDLAVIGIQNVNTTERLLREKEIAIRGVMSLSFVHHMNNQIGGLKERALIIKDHSLRISPNDASLQIADIRYQVNKIIEITNNFLLTADLMTQTFREEKQRVHLNTILESSLRNVGLPKSIMCEVMLEDLPPVLGGVEQLNFIFTNLILNAVDAMPNGGKLLIKGKVSTDGNDTLVRIDVSDTGIGIKEEHLQQVFDYGFTTKDAKAQNGLGLGLWITRYSIEHLGGLIVVQSQFHEGSIFTVKLPACSPDF